MNTYGSPEIVSLDFQKNPEVYWELAKLPMVARFGKPFWGIEKRRAESRWGKNLHQQPTTNPEFKTSTAI